MVINHGNVPIKLKDVPINHRNVPIKSENVPINHENIPINKKHPHYEDVLRISFSMGCFQFIFALG